MIFESVFVLFNFLRIFQEIVYVNQTMSSLTGEDDPFETESKSVYRDYLVSKYPDLCTSDYTSNSLISNLSSFKLKLSSCDYNQWFTIDGWIHQAQLRRTQTVYII